MLEELPNDVEDALFKSMIMGSELLEMEAKRSMGKFGYPKVRSGRLRDSIYHKTRKVGQKTASIIGTDVEYGQFLEQGNYPFLRPTVERNEQRLSEIIVNFMTKELNR